MNSQSISVSVADDADGADWNAFVDAAADSEIYHRFEWSQIFKSVFGQRCFFLIARDADAAVVGLLPLVQLKSRLFGNFLVSTPCFNYCGILAANDVARDALREHAATLAEDIGASHVELRHRAGVSMELPFRDDKISMRLALPDSSEALWKQFSSKLRAQIRRPQKEGAQCVDGGLALVDEFYSVFSRNMRDLGTPVFPKSLFIEVFKQFPRHCRLFVVRIGDQAVSGGFTIGHRRTLEIPSASSLREFNRFSPNMLLYWSILQHAIQQQFHTFDFGRTSRESGPYRFKRQWGAEPEDLAWHYILRSGDTMPRLNPDNPKYRLAVRLWRHLPLAVANSLGPRIVRHLP